MNIGLQGKTALICGASQGLGRSIALELAQSGASCLLLARNEQRLQEILPELPQLPGQQHRVLVQDLSRFQELKEKLGNLLERTAVHILVTNSGGPASGPLLDAQDEAIRGAFEQHVLANQFLARSLVPFMREARYGRIINVLSTSVRTPLRNLGVSNTIRWAVASWAKTLATELAAYGITVNNILPGSTRTARLEYLIGTQAERQHRSVEEVEQEWLREIPAGRFGKPEEIAALVAFMASPAAAYITGTSIQVDGGKTPSM